VPPKNGVFKNVFSKIFPKLFFESGPVTASVVSGKAVVASGGFKVVVNSKTASSGFAFWLRHRFLGRTHFSTTHLGIWEFFGQETYIYFVAQETRITRKLFIFNFFSPKRSESAIKVR